MAETSTLAREPAGDAVADLKRENAQLKAYLRAFVRATYSHQRDCYGGQTPAQDATGMHRVNPGMTYSFGLNELEGDDPVITGGQVMRAMELLGEAPELTSAEEAKNLQAVAVLHSVQGTVAMAIEAIAGRKGEPSTPEMLERLAAAGSPAQARAQYLAAALVHLRAIAEGIPAVLKRTPVDVRELAALVVQEVDDLIGESEGVAGLHHNGDVAPWGDLEPGGEYERLTSLNDLRAALAQGEATRG